MPLGYLFRLQSNCHDDRIYTPLGLDVSWPSVAQITSQYVFPPNYHRITDNSNVGGETSLVYAVQKTPTTQIPTVSTVQLDIHCSRCAKQSFALQ